MSTQQELRRESERNFYILIDCVRVGVNDAILSGITATELWLGPIQARVLEVEMNWQDAEGRLRHSAANQSALIKGTVEGAELMGLRIRLMVAEGLRVGVSWPKPIA
jgi:hypothetical protein